MDEVISLDGLRKLASMEKKPESFRVMVLNYLKHKEDWINSGKCIDGFAVEKFVEALRIAERLGITWKIKIIRF